VEEQFAGVEPIGGNGQPEEVANAVFWICNDKPFFTL
jgi:hypothetical protein